MNILVTSLSRKTTKDELNKLFAEFGTVTSISLVMDDKTGKSKGFGFVEMGNQKEALAAIKGLNKTRVKSERISVKQAKDPKDKE